MHRYNYEVICETGAEVVIACRDIAKAETAANEISNETNGKVTTITLDLASMSSIRVAADKLKARYPKIHILINNAGMCLIPSCMLNQLYNHNNKEV